MWAKASYPGYEGTDLSKSEALPVKAQEINARIKFPSARVCLLQIPRYSLSAGTLSNVSLHDALASEPRFTIAFYQLWSLFYKGQLFLDLH